MRNLIMLLILLVSAPLFARDVYKWTNGEGVVIYSDTYQEGAERIRVNDDKSAAPRQGSTQGDQQAAESEGGGAYESMQIVEPENDATVRNNEGNVIVGLRLTPTLSETHSIKIILDNASLPEEMKASRFTLTGLNRGTHTLETQVVDSEGNVIITSNRINFHLRQASIKTP